MELLGLTIDTIGKLLVSYTAVRVHYRFWKEHRIDEKLFVVMHKEQAIGILGMALIIIGYAIQAVAII